MFSGDLLYLRNINGLLFSKSIYKDDVNSIIPTDIIKIT